MADYPSFTRGMNFGQSAPVKPLWTVNFEDEDEFLAWFKEAAESLADEHRERTERDLRNRDFYMGLQSLSLGREGIPRDREGRPLEKFARVTINQCYELIEQWKSKMTRYPPAIAVIPSNDEHNDKIAAQLSKDFIDYLFYQNDIDDVLEDVASICRIDGEVFLFITWDKNKGDVHPDLREAKKLGERVPLIDPATGEQMTGEDGNPLFIDERQKIGDVAYDVVQRKYVMRQPKSKWKDVDWIIKISSQDVDELRADYPEKAAELHLSGTERSSYIEYFSADADWNETLVYELYHRSTRFLDAGRYIKFTDSVVLENGPLPYSHGELPVCRLTNIDIPDSQYGYSFIDQILLLQVMYNNLASIAYTNISLGSHLYWLVPKQGGVDISKLRNSASVIKYNAGMPPSIQQFNVVGQEIFKMLEFVEQAIQRISGIQGVSRGEPPAGIEAGIALAFLEEQENQRANVDIKKHNAFIKKLARMSLAVAGDYYDPSDGRTIRIVGKNNAYSTKALDVASLGQPYDIRVQRTTALSESKSGRLSQILALESRFPGKIPWEQVADMLDLASDEKFFTLASVAVKAAERENESMMEGRPVMDAVEFEEHVQHWYSHVKFMQTPSFKEDTPEYIKMLFIKHCKSHEFWIHTKLQTGGNPLFAQRVMQLENFPAFTLAAPIGGPPMAGAPAPTGPGVPPVGAPPGGPLPPGGLEGQPEAIDTGEGALGAVAPEQPPMPPNEVPNSLGVEQR